MRKSLEVWVRRPIKDQREAEQSDLEPRAQRATAASCTEIPVKVENHEFQASLGYIERPCFKKTNIPKER